MRFTSTIGRVVILPQMSRSGDGSTTYEKKFAGGLSAARQRQLR
jgi:hypothetical protein